MVASIVSLSSLDGNNGFRMDGTVKNERLGRSVSNAGDVNGDGVDDLIIGASGSSYVVFGKTSGFSAAMNLSSLNGSNGFRLNGTNLGVSNAGDVNGDGFDDVILGTQNADSSYVVFGKASGFSATMDLSSLDGNNGFRLDGATNLELTGISVSGAGDINGDGYDDLIIGSASRNNYDYGASPITPGFVVFGKASGFDPTLDLSNLDGSDGFHVDVFSSTGLAFAKSVSSAGDVNGDGYDDLILGILFPSPYRDATKGNVSYVVFGKSSGFDSAFILNDLDGSNGFRLNIAGASQYDPSGLSVSSAGDINGDGFDDLIIGGKTDSSDSYYGGAAYVVFGKASGFDAVLDRTILDGVNGFRLRGEPYSYLGISVSGAGDINGDGFDDLIVGAPSTATDSNNHIYAGASYVVFGKASGFDAILDLTRLDGNDGFRLDGVTGLDKSGVSVSGAGDINGDGLADLIVGSYRADPNGTDSGSSYVVFGQSNVNEKVIQGTSGHDYLTGTSAAERFEADDGNDSMIGRGGADVYHGGAGNDYIRIFDPNFKSVDGGTGKDILAMGGSGWNLNLADVGNKISSIETISLFGTGDNTLTLTAADVHNLSDTTNILKVNGNAGDSIVGLSHGWKDGGIHGNFHTFTSTSDAAVLLVGVNVETDFVL